jgi:hypothetical protein
LDNIKADVTVHGDDHDGRDVLKLNDQGDSDNKTYDITSSTIFLHLQRLRHFARSGYGRCPVSRFAYGRALAAIGRPDGAFLGQWVGGHVVCRSALGSTDPGRR